MPRNKDKDRYNLRKALAVRLMLVCDEVIKSFKSDYPNYAEQVGDIAKRSQKMLYSLIGDEVGEQVTGIECICRKCADKLTYNEGVELNEVDGGRERKEVCCKCGKTTYCGHYRV